MEEDQKDLLQYHMTECRDRYLAIEKRLARIEGLIVAVLLSIAATLLHVSGVLH